MFLSTFFQSPSIRKKIILFFFILVSTTTKSIQIPCCSFGFISKAATTKKRQFIYDLSVLLAFKKKMCILREYKDTFFSCRSRQIGSFLTSLRPFDGCYLQSYFQNYPAMDGQLLRQCSLR
jgi:hypothetical protein